MGIAVTRRRFPTGPRKSLRAAIAVSLIVHTAVIVLALTDWRPPPPKAIPISFDMAFVSPPSPDPDDEAKPVPAPPAPPKPVEPKPEPKKEEPKKEEPKPEPKKEPEKKPEPKKEPPKKKEPEKKPEPKKEPPKKETAKKEPPKKEEKKPEAAPPPNPSTVPAPEVVAKAPPASSGVQQSQLPSALNMWGRQVQKKIYRFWAAPSGQALTPENRDVSVSFWVDRNGMLLSQPEVVAGSNQALGQSGINAIISAQPLPPLPLEYVAERQQVIYVFSLMDFAPIEGGTG